MPDTKNTEISIQADRIDILASNSNKSKNDQGTLDLFVKKDGDFEGVGMGVLSDGTPYLNQRGLAKLCGVENAHIGTISSQWNDSSEKPRIKAIKSILQSANRFAPVAHIQLIHKGKTHYCYPAEICLAILEYYAFDAGSNNQDQARQNYRILAGSKLREMIFSKVGYDPDREQINALRKWHERIELNHKSAPAGYFSIFNEAHSIIYELIMAGANIGNKVVPDISIGSHWAKYWKTNNLASIYGKKEKFPHKYPSDHPQARSNPQIANCYPLEALGEYRKWLEEVYLGQGKFSKYLNGIKTNVPSQIAETALARLAPH